MAKHDTDGYLQGTVMLKARLLRDIGAARKSMGGHPGALQVASGSKLRYHLGGEKDHFFVAELRPDSVAVETYSRTSPLYFLCEAFLRLLGLCAFLSAEYEVDLNSAYPYLIDILAKSQVAQLSGKMAENTCSRDTDLILSRRILSLVRENISLRECQAKSEALANRLLASLLVLKHGHGADPEEIAKEYGIERKDVDVVLSAMPQYGYRVVHSGEKKISLVRM